MRAAVVLPALLVLAPCLAACAGGAARPDTAGATGEVHAPAAAGVAAFAGEVEAIDNGCFADGTCSVTVAGRTIVTMRGWSQATWGTRDPDLAVGDAVEVRCRDGGDGACTLEGDAGLYVRKAH